MKVLKPIIFFLLSFSLWLPLFGMEEQTTSRKRKRDESALTHQESAYVLISQTGGRVQIKKSLLKRARLFEKVMNDADQTDKSIPTQLSQEAIEFVEDFLRFLERLEQALERKMHNKKNAKIVHLEEKKQKKINFFNTLKDYYLYKHAHLINGQLKKKMQNIKHQLKQFDKPEKLLDKKQKDLEQRIKTLDDVFEIRKREKLTKKIHNFLKQKATSFREFLNLAEIGDYIGCEILFESAIDLAAKQINDDAAREIIPMLSPAIATALYEKIKQSIIEKKY